MKKLTFIEVLRAADLRVRSYSGRGMFGKTCVAVEIENDIGELFSEVLESISNYSSDEQNEAIELCVKNFRRMMTDSMGRGQIAYWPSVEYTEEHDEDEDEEDGAYA